MWLGTVKALGKTLNMQSEFYLIPLSEMTEFLCIFHLTSSKLIVHIKPDWTVWRMISYLTYMLTEALFWEFSINFGWSDEAMNGDRDVRQHKYRLHGLLPHGINDHYLKQLGTNFSENWNQNAKLLRKCTWKCRLQNGHHLLTFSKVRFFL